MPGTVTLDCPAKLNLALAVGLPDPHDPSGLHPIASWMAALSLADRLTVRAIDASVDETTKAKSTFRLHYAADAPSPQEIDWPLEKDLMFRAHAWLEHHTGRALPVEAKLQKRIPTGAGLGGGSSDAAGMIVALDQLFDLSLTDEDRRRCASALGSDVHFALAALSGTYSAFVEGSGDRWEPTVTPGAWPLHVALVLPPFGCPTGPVYGAFDRLIDADHVLDATRVRVLPTQLTPDGAGLFNDLAAAAASVEPQLEQLLAALHQYTPRPVHVTGSGAACFVIAESETEAEALADSVTVELGVPAIATRTL